MKPHKHCELIKLLAGVYDTSKLDPHEIEVLKELSAFDHDDSLHCFVCNTPMGLRHGKFGAFHYCREHGTFSIQGKRLHATKSVYMMYAKISSSMMRLRFGLVVSTVPTSRFYREFIDEPAGHIEPYLNQPNLDLNDLVIQGIAAMGLHMTDTDLFLSDVDPSAYQNLEDEEPDHWMAGRPW
jgi:hypothetical protein